MKRVKRYLKRLKLPRRRLIRFTTFLNQFRLSQRVWWIVSNKRWYDSYFYRFTIKVIRFIWSQRAPCLFQKSHKLIQACLIRFMWSHGANECFMETTQEGETPSLLRHMKCNLSNNKINHFVHVCRIFWGAFTQTKNLTKQHIY